MTKQGLATKIWAMANELRKGIKASLYKDYILGFMFYKYLSDKEIQYLLDAGGSLDDLKNPDDTTMAIFQDHIGYFIAFEDLFSTWIDKKSHLTASDVSKAISKFYDNVNPIYKKFFENIFKTLSSGLSELGNNTGSVNTAVQGIVNIINDIPTTNKNYDVLGYIYEYLIKKFSSEAKKDGAFYTPHGLTSLMAKIVAERIKGRQEIKVYDPTIGTAGLLLNIGKEVGKYISPEQIHYYGQEYNPETCNLAKMNLFMQDIHIQRVRVRHGNTLEEDWPYFDENTAYEALPVDIVVSNPPYSQGWNSRKYRLDERFRFGLAPDGKADYAFLLHCLYHVKHKEGIMAIVLPHGVLFRGGSEYQIRKNLIDNYNIETIIGFPANMFFSTGIPVIVMILSKGRTDSDVLFIDASTSYGKEGTQNILREMDIQRIFETVRDRKTVDNFSRLVSLEQIIENDYNLNIPRYVSATPLPQPVDPYSVMTGKISSNDMALFANYWKQFPSLQEELFSLDGNYYVFTTSDLKNTVFNNHDVQQYLEQCSDISTQFRSFLLSVLIQNAPDTSAFDEIKTTLFNRYSDTPLLDRYAVYQAFCDAWGTIEEDIKEIRDKGRDVCRQTEPNEVLIKENGKYKKDQKGIKGIVFPFDLIEEEYDSDRLKNLRALTNQVSDLENEIADLWNELEDEAKSKLTKEDDDSGKMDTKKIGPVVTDIISRLSIPETEPLETYLESQKAEKLAIIAAHPEFGWPEFQANKDGTYSPSIVRSIIETVKQRYLAESDTDEGRIVAIKSKLEEKSALSRKAKVLAKELEDNAVARMKELTDGEIDSLLTKKWIDPVMANIEAIIRSVLEKLIKRLTDLQTQYGTTLPEIDRDIEQTEKALNEILGELKGGTEDMEALAMFRRELFS